MEVSQRRFEPAVLVALALGFFLALALRLSLFYFESGDYLVFLSPWYDSIVSYGGFSALEYAFSDYSPLYLYLLTLATYLPLPKLYAIKLVSISFDFLLALFVLLIVRLKYENRVVWVSSFFAALFAPTVFVNSALWGQSDATYASMLVASIYFAIQRRPNLSVFFFSVGLSFKLQAVFLFPLFIVLFLKRRVPIYSFLIIPATYMVTLLPAWLAGRPLVELLMTYPAQAGQHALLTQYAPNLYWWVPYDSLSAPQPDSILLLNRILSWGGIVFTALLVGLLCLVSWRSPVPLDKDVIVKLSLVSVLLLPFTLPHMHDRYFFAADVISIIYAFYWPKRFFIPIIVGAASLFSYMPFLFVASQTDLLPYLPALFRILGVLMGIALVVVAADLIRSLYPHSIEKPGSGPPGPGKSKL